MAHEPARFAITLRDNSQGWLTRQERRLNLAVDKMGNAIKEQARVRAPKLNGDLRKSGRIEESKDKVVIIYGGGNVPYGAYQERGHRYDGSYQVKRYTTPNTGAHYLEDAGKRNTQKGIKWLLSRS